MKEGDLQRSAIFRTRRPCPLSCIVICPHTLFFIFCPLYFFTGLTTYLSGFSSRSSVFIYFLSGLGGMLFATYVFTRLAFRCRSLFSKDLFFQELLSDYSLFSQLSLDEIGPGP